MTATTLLRRAARVTASVLLASLLLPAAAMSLREMAALEKSDPKHGAEYVQYYLVGAMEGALETNAHVVRAGGKPLFCLNGRRLEPRMARGLVDAERKRHPGVYEADMPVQLVMLQALATSYPC
jgi:hypothetical protein